MKAIKSITAFALLALLACNNVRKENNQTTTSPKAFDDKGSSFDLSIKRGNDDLVESLYSELAEKTPELKELETKFDNLSESKEHSTEAFNKYDFKNSSYYNSANNHIAQIKDSVLRDKVKSLIAASFNNYKSKILKHSELLNSIDNKTLALEDLHTILKLTRTLPLLEKYQQDNIPSIKPIESYLKQVDATMYYADSIAQKKQ